MKEKKMPRIVSVKQPVYLTSNEEIKKAYEPYWNKMEDKKPKNNVKTVFTTFKDSIGKMNEFVASDDGQKLMEGSKRASGLLLD